MKMPICLSSTTTTTTFSFTTHNNIIIKPTKSSIINFPSPQTKTNPILSLSLSISPHYHSFKCYSSASSQVDPSHISNETREDTEVEAEKAEAGPNKMWESVETLTKFYKEAVLAEDYHTITEIEAAFYRLESEKNELAEKLSVLSGEVTSGKEKYIRLQADFDNFRKRSEKERLSIRTDAQGEVIESLLPMVDNFERARQQLKPETDREKQIETSYQGIYKQFVEIMRSLRVSAIPAVGKPFDPSKHEAIAREESEEYKEGLIIQEFRRGFFLGDRLLRPAMVKVSSGPGKGKETRTAQKSTEQAAASPLAQEQPAAAGIDER